VQKGVIIKNFLEKKGIEKKGDTTLHNQVGAMLAARRLKKKKSGGEDLERGCVQEKKPKLVGEIRPVLLLIIG